MPDVFRLWVRLPSERAHPGVLRRPGVLPADHSAVGTVGVRSAVPARANRAGPHITAPSGGLRSNRSKLRPPHITACPAVCAPDDYAVPRTSPPRRSALQPQQAATPAHLQVMSTRNLTRQPAGVPVGGQFAATQRTETGTALTGRTPEAVLQGFADDAFPQVEDAEAGWVISRVQARRDARTVLADLSDKDFYDRHWFGIESAAMQVQRFADDVDGEEAAAAAPGDTLSVDISDYAEWNEPDRPGENGYTGYNFPGFAAAVTDAWRHELTDRITQAVQANAAATPGDQTAA